MNLSCVKKSVLISEVKHLLNVSANALAKQRNEMGKNVIDPFAATFEMAGFGLSHDEWAKSEQTRQAQKTLQNHIGAFHQNLLGSVKDWENLHSGAVVDLVCHKHKIIAEIKNKHNTLTGGKRSDLYKDLERLVMPKASRYKGYTAYFVTVIPRNAERFDDFFTPSDKGKGAPCPSNPLIRTTDGASFYAKVTGEHDALNQVFRALPEVVKTVSGTEFSRADQAELLEYFQTAFAA